MPPRPTDGPAHPRLFPADPFVGFGPSLFRVPDEPAIGRGLRSKRPARLRLGVREYAPRLPGVYGMLDAKGRVVYVGKAKSLRCRLLSYFRENSRDPKAGKILEHTRTLVWEEAADEFAALLRELELIQRLGPRFNVLGRPGLQRYHYVCVGKGPAAYAYVAKSPTGKELGCYGPLVARHRSEDAVRRLNDWFKLRDCPQTVPLAFADQAELFPEDRGPKCLRLELGTCRGPCAAACTRAEYAEGVRGVKAFLSGRDRGLLGMIREQMAAAAANFEFERATALRDRLQSLEWLDDRLALLRRARDRNSFVYPLAGHTGAERWYLIHRGQVRAVMPAPQTPADFDRAAALIRATFTDTPAPLLLTGGAVDSVLLVAAWFRKNPTEKARLLTKVAALGQVS
ncbi:MAG: GIY-YIG nuclease family protein [Gemmataceae bacterium]|nr:GIY-YIG nuclease family protein [Gemmataceae bacterium]